jgi:hypothetical protein
MTKHLLAIVTAFLTVTLSFPFVAQARITPNDIYQQKRAEFDATVSRLPDQSKKDRILKADRTLKTINQTVTRRFDDDIARMSAILEELKSRENVTDNVVAFGSGDTPIDTAAYDLNFAAEAVAYQKIQDYTPQFSGSNIDAGIANSQANLRSNLITLRGKVLRAKSELQKALEYYEK